MYYTILWAGLIHEKFHLGNQWNVNSLLFITGTSGQQGRVNHVPANTHASTKSINAASRLRYLWTNRTDNLRHFHSDYPACKARSLTAAIGWPISTYLNQFGSVCRVCCHARWNVHAWVVGTCRVLRHKHEYAWFWFTSRSILDSGSLWIKKFL